MNTESRNDQESLGAFLRKSREKKNLSLEEAADSTKISLANLKALEEDDYDNLPADTFARGFCVIYANYLELDADEVRERYNQQSINLPKKNSKRAPTPGQLALETSSMAQPPTAVSTSVIGLLLLTLLVVGAILCWYFSWNPAAYLSQKLRGGNDQHAATSQAEPVLPASNAPVAPAVSGTPAAPAGTDTSSSAIHPGMGAVTAGSDTVERSGQERTASTQPTASLADQPPQPAASPEKGTTSDRQVVSPQNSAVSGSGPYILKASFKEATRLTIKIDNTPTEHLNFRAGEERTWSAEKSIVVTLPAETAVGASLTLNNLPLTLPKRGPGEDIAITIPE